MRTSFAWALPLALILAMVFAFAGDARAADLDIVTLLSGTSLASWGVPEGPFLFLPILGPSDPRDAAGFGVDIALDPFTWIGTGPNHPGWTAFKWTRQALNAVDQRERALDTLDQIKKTALDPYATFRSLYRQHRHAQIEDMRNDHRATVPAWYPSPAKAPAQ